MPASVAGAEGRARGSTVGPYTVLRGLDDEASGIPVPERRFIGRSADGDRTVLISAPLPGADPGRFLAEAETSRYLLGPWSSPATEVAAPGDAPWHARPYVPALPLPAALTVHGGPLPERTVRALGAALAETLAIGHGQDLAHAGVSPAAVLLAADGPRLTCFGAVRAAAEDGTPRSGLPGLESGSLPPEEAAGGRPHPAGDVYALGATLAYAATGYTVPEREELPAALRSVVTACLSRDPAARPRPAELLDVLGAGVPAAAPPAPASGPASPGTVLIRSGDPAGRAAAPLGPGWLPGRIIAALARQSAELLAATLPVPPAPQD
ncbi:serine/threonine protein kinase [Streptomyces sp. SID8375]|uniref:serine/threonine protein kinase n=1 Tax=unclassified Streptomyces TaxID=2593676 RepID=UPI0004771596|nr:MULTISPECIES: serine/threonine protein kinase [unclassified Streptomyces]MYX06994.1 serine/threonine protein kinase [Streptomyces sp. SID8375]